MSTDHKIDRQVAHAADERDEQASARDESAAERDRQADTRDSFADPADAPLARAAAARDRADAAHDRQLAAADRAHAAAARATAGADDLTGVLTRGVGLAAVEREVERSRRSQAPLVLAFVDVNGLKQINDSLGHAAGDRLLKRTADLISAQLRPYDLVVRVGGDEFVCSLQGIDADGVRERFDRVSAALAAGPEGGSITVGLAERANGDSLDDLLLRADRQLLAQRGAGSLHARTRKR